ncbi:MAG TPA: hypothetical protein VHG53_02175 [Candidatus Limnocylindria bacterium]|nr:hypothetical protein [Candidatus Limnocylindria bacterium]
MTDLDARRPKDGGPWRELNMRVTGKERQHIELIVELGLASSTSGAIRFALADTARRLRQGPR